MIYGSMVWGVKIVLCGKGMDGRVSEISSYGRGGSDWQVSAWYRVLLVAGVDDFLYGNISEGQFSEILSHSLSFSTAVQRVLPTGTKDQSGTSQSKSGTSVNLSNSGWLAWHLVVVSGRYCTSISPSAYTLDHYHQHHTLHTKPRTSSSASLE